LVFPNEDSIQVIYVEIRPNEPSPYKHCKVSFQLTFPDTYPIDAPKLKCLNRIYHPNINYEGAVCLPLVREDYTPTVNLTMIICGLIFIMTYPNGEDPLNPNIGDLMLKTPDMFLKILEYTT
jgi:ubiquitin-conjugating enzyme E2 M